MPKLVVSEETELMLKNESIELPAQEILQRRIIAAAPKIASHPKLLIDLSSLGGKKMTVLEIFARVEKAFRTYPLPKTETTEAIEGIAEIFFNKKEIKKWVVRNLPTRLTVAHFRRGRR